MATAKKSARRKSRATTIGEVAALAKVSPMTVSRVINGNVNVRDTTRERVMRAVRELDYTPNLAASSLAAAKATRIALIYTNPSAGYLRELLVGVLHSTAGTAVQLVIEAWDDLKSSQEKRNSARALAKSVAGVIIPPPLCESKTVVSELVAAGVPVVAVASGGCSEEVSRVRIDDFRAGKEVTEHLIALGHTRIGHIKGHPYLSASALRFEGYQVALSQAGIRMEPGLVEQGYFTYRSGLAAAEKLLDRRHPPTAIFAANDDMAAALISVAHRRGLHVPDDLSVVGFDDTPTATMVWPELTTVHQPIGEIADAAIEVLVRSIQNQDRDVRVVVDRVMGHTLVERDSVAPPAGTKR